MTEKESLLGKERPDVEAAAPAVQHESPVQYKAYPSRYYVLIVTALFAMQQNIAWLTFGPIPTQAKETYGLTEIEVTILPEYSPMAFILLTVPFAWFLHRYGLRVTGIGGVWILAVGCGIRVFVPFLPEATEWIWVIHLGHILIGLAGLPIMLMPSEVSATWFPAKERSFATAITVNAEGFGTGLGFIFISLLTQQYGIRTMLYVQAEMALFVALLATIYFPPRPPSPPSPSAGESRVSFLQAMKKLTCNRNFVLLTLSGGIISGAVFGFSSVLGIILNKDSGFNNHVIVHSVHEFFSSVAWLGMTSAICGTLLGQFFGYFADRFQKKFKLILLSLLLASTVFSIWFSISLYGWGNKNPINYFVSFALVNIFSVAAFPIFYEAIVENTYPVAEGTSTGGLAYTINAGTLLFAIIGISGVFSESHPERAKAMAWVLTGACIISTILVLAVKERYHRLDIDKKAPPSHTGIQAHSETSPVTSTQ